MMLLKRIEAEHKLNKTNFPIQPMFSFIAISYSYTLYTHDISKCLLQDP